jgi:hypothetical protein
MHGACNTINKTPPLAYGISMFSFKFVTKARVKIYNFF